MPYLKTCQMQSRSTTKLHYMQKLTQKQMTDLNVELKLQNYRRQQA